MRTLTKFLLGSVGALTLAAAAAPSQAAVVQVWYSLTPNTPFADLTALGNPGDPFTSASGGPLGVFSIVSANGGVASVPLFNSSNLDISATGPGFIDIFVSVTGLTAPISAGELFKTVLTANVVPSDWTIVEQAWLDKNNNAGTGESLGFATFGPSADGDTHTEFHTIDTGGGPYAISTEFRITAGSAFNGSLSNTISVTALGAVPEPTTWGLMLVGFGGAGAMLRRRRAVAAAA